MSKIPFPYSTNDLLNTTADEVFATLIRQSTNGVTVNSNAAPSLATQFVKSSASQRAAPGVDGAFAELIFPSHEDVNRRTHAKHGNEKLFGYSSSARSDAFPAGYGEKAARALAREETSYQLKGVFPSAAMSYSKLRAVIEAREGDVEALDTIFATMWGLPLDSVQMLPQLNILGSEATRISALEDRAYHSLAAHPCASGGFRVDTATLAPDALGANVPLNWPRIRLALKAIAHIQLYGDLAQSSQIHTLNSKMEFRFRMDFALGAQPQYHRSANWETLVERVILGQSASSRLLDRRAAEPGYQLHSQMSESGIAKMLLDDGITVSENIRAIASTVSDASNKALLKTIEILVAADQARHAAEALEGAELDEFEESEMSNAVEVPKYKVVRTSMYKGICDEFSTRSTIPDMVSHGKPRKTLNFEEFRESNITMPVDIPTALHLAVYMTVQRPRVQPYAYELMMRLSAIEKQLRVRPTMHSESEAPLIEKAATRLRKQDLYADESIRSLGESLFGMDFNSIFEMLLRNMATQPDMQDQDVKKGIWSYLCKRSHTTKVSDVPGDWRDLIEYLWYAPEGWTLYYWVRMTIGRTHHAATSGILAPITAGTEVDALTMVKAGVKDRARRWADIYSGKYRQIEGRISASREKRRAIEEKCETSKVQEGGLETRYIPPHARKLVDLEQQYDADEILSRAKSFEAEEYIRMVSAQTKAKFFANIDVFTRNRKIIVGLSDSKMREMLVEFYQARWYSLEVRIKKASERGKPFRLGEHVFLVHPWGDLQTELPATIRGMLDFMSNLDMRAWTLPPDHVYAQLEKALGELWADVHAEVQALKSYALDVHEGVVEQQDEQDLISTAKTVMHAMAGIPAIPVPAPGYRAPSSMPTRSIQIETKASSSAPQQREVKTIIVTNEDSEEDEELQDYEGEVQTYFVNTTETAQVMDASVYLTLRVIWNNLGLPDTDENAMKFALACGYDANLDAPHVDSNIGPLLYVGEEARVAAVWKNHLPAIRRRLTGEKTNDLGADM